MQVNLLLVSLIIVRHQIDKKNELGYRAKAINLQNQLLVSDRNQLSFFLEDIDNQNLNQIRSSVEKTSQGQDL